MNRKKFIIKNIIIVVYLISILLFNIITYLNLDNFLDWYRETMDYGNPAILLGPFIMAEILHIAITIVLAIIVRFIKKIDKEIKMIFYLMPISTIFFWIPMMVLCSYMGF